MKKSEPMSESYFYILLCLAKGANHGYGIMQMTAQLSEGTVTIGSGTMYGATSNMMKKGWIHEIMSTEEGMERGSLTVKQKHHASFFQQNRAFRPIFCVKFRVFACSVCSVIML